MSPIIIGDLHASFIVPRIKCREPDCVHPDIKVAIINEPTINVGIIFACGAHIDKYVMQYKHPEVFETHTYCPGGDILLWDGQIEYDYIVAVDQDYIYCCLCYRQSATHAVICFRHGKFAALRFVCSQPECNNDQMMRRILS